MAAAQSGKTLEAAQRGLARSAASGPAAPAGEHLHLSRGEI